MSDLSKKKCVPCEGGAVPLSPEEADALLAQLDGWTREDGRIRKTYGFKNYYETMAFVNAVAYVAHREDHHPDLLVRYKTCEVSYTTHAIGGLSENDFICAGILDELIV
jgi:4a-hydroxytetrahydrobiopterin dehydratase